MEIVNYIILRSWVLGMGWLSAFLIPFLRFDYAPVALCYLFPVLVLVLPIAIAVRYCIRPYPSWWIRFATVMAWLCAVLSPFAPLGTLFFLSWRASLVVKHWPQVMLDDPGLIWNKEAEWDAVSDAAIYSFAVSGVAFSAFVALLLHLAPSLPPRHTKLLLATFLIGWAMFAFDPTQRFLWWMD